MPDAPLGKDPMPEAPRPDEGSAADRLIAALEGEGAPAEPRHFTLELGAALEKVGRFALASPEDAALMLVRAAVRRDARRIHVRVEADELRVEFDGRPFSESALRGLFDALLVDSAGDQEGGRRELAIAVATARHLSLRSLVVESGGAEAGVRLALRPDEPIAVEPAPAALHGTRVRWRRALGAEVVARQATHAAGRLPEVVALRDRCRYCPVEILLQGEPIAREREGDGGRLPGITILDEPGLRAAVTRDSDGREEAEVRVVRDGVWIDTLPLPGEPPELRVVVEAAALHTDLTGFQVVRNEGWAAVTRRLRQGTDGLQVQLAKALASGDEAVPRAHRRWAQRVVRREVLRRVAETDPRAVPPDGPLGALVAAPVWSVLDPAGAGWRWIGTAALFEALAQAGGATILEVPPGEPLPRLNPRVVTSGHRGHLVAVRDADARAWLGTHAPGAVSVRSAAEVDELVRRFPPSRFWGIGSGRLPWLDLIFWVAVAGFVVMLLHIANRFSC